MPYIKQEKRPQYNAIVNELITECLSDKPSIVIVESTIRYSIAYLTNNGTIVLENSDDWKGELNYLISKFCHELIDHFGLRYHVLNDIIGILRSCQNNNEFTCTILCSYRPSGRLINWKGTFKYFVNNIVGEMRKCKVNYIKDEITGVLECIKLELYRQIAAGYEDIKKLENGPVSELDSTSLEDVCD